MFKVNLFIIFTVKILLISVLSYFKYLIKNMLSWYHSGFKVYCGPAIWPKMKTY